MDLEKFFDTVNQSKLIEILSRKGGPLSLLCANIMLNELEHELKKRGISIIVK